MDAADAPGSGARYLLAAIGALRSSYESDIGIRQPEDAPWRENIGQAVETLIVEKILKEQVTFKFRRIRKPQYDPVILVLGRSLPKAQAPTKAADRRVSCERPINKKQEMLLDREFLVRCKVGRQIRPEKFPVEDVTMVVENAPRATEMQFGEELRVGKHVPEQKARPVQTPPEHAPPCLAVRDVGQQRFRCQPVLDESANRHRRTL
jgi:hypothetical protein